MNHEPPRVDLADVRQAVALGVRDAVSDPAMWEAAFDAFNEYAQSRTGRFFLGSVGTILRKFLLGALIVLFIYSVGGWHSVVAFFKAVTS